MIIEITPERLHAFCRQWPAHGLGSVDRLTIEADDNGEIVDFTAYRERITSEDERGEIIAYEDIDGSAIAALIETAIHEDSEDPTTQWEAIGNVELAVPVEMWETYGPGPWDGNAEEFGPRLAALNPSVSWRQLAPELEEYGIDREWDATTAWEYAAWIIAGDVYERSASREDVHERIEAVRHQLENGNHG